MEIPIGFAAVAIKFGSSNAEHDPVVTFGVELDALPATAQEVADAVVAAAQTADLADLTMNGALLSAEVKLGPSLTGPSAVAPIGVGSLTGDLVSPNVAVLVRKLTASGGRAGRGRFYWPFIQEAAVDSSGAIGSSTLDLYQGVFTAFRNALEANDVPPVLLHGAASPITEPSSITAFTVDGRVATQRRRLR